MKPRLLATPLVAAILLLSTLGCSKKNDPATKSLGTGSYKLDGVVKSCEVKSAFFPATSSQTYDQLDVTLTTVPQPARGVEQFVLSFTKQPSQSATAYQLYAMGYFPDGLSTNGVIYTNDVTTLKEAGGIYSGTFSGGYIPFPSNPALHTVTDGVFANTQP